MMKVPAVMMMTVVGMDLVKYYSRKNTIAMVLQILNIDHWSQESVLWMVVMLPVPQGTWCVGWGVVAKGNTS
jgi:hypothetical protein